MNAEDEEIQPDIMEARWPREHILELLSDLSRGIEGGKVRLEHVQLRQRTDNGIDESESTLSEVHVAFVSGKAIAIQIRYTFEGEAWCDTILPEGDLSAIVRTRQTN